MFLLCSVPFAPKSNCRTGQKVVLPKICIWDPGDEMGCNAREYAVLLLYADASGSDTGIVFLVPIIG